jgi:hypothetical protein
MSSHKKSVSLLIPHLDFDKHKDSCTINNINLEQHFQIIQLGKDN